MARLWIAFQPQGLESLLAWLVSVGADLVGHSIADLAALGQAIAGVHVQPPAPRPPGLRKRPDIARENCRLRFRDLFRKGRCSGGEDQETTLDGSKKPVKERMF
ncbi:hypothetical protein GGTG_00014 [Gaeumannomyces tritici R3-111a-1]|uniref:Uncharacterized protein n=1 Tax=Gaeumannomyces tritici (strain R3-111a-1) TaxID=644352 RepID=J3NFG8_GAET3|nr:hypothetical protein GGTG_00014 [Gaeumannomyces tritici R3-111a-1]EJT80008.1 hypothetical protein GGTG_00014 [Gaeumannomyces tritici R3-111a-1]